MAAPVSHSSSTNTAASTARHVPATAVPSTQVSSSRDSKSGSFDNPSRNVHTLSPQRMASQQEMWKLEQYIVGALVRVDPDPTVDNSVVDGQNNPLFDLVPDDHRDIFSFSTTPELYGGVDVSFPSTADDSADGEAVAVYVVIDRRTMNVVYHDHTFFPLEVPYVPGFLAFREISPLQLLVQRQVQNHPAMTPRAILVDGNGILHPRQAGLACFLGTRTDIPTIGIGKSLLHGCGWTRESVDDALDQFIQDVHTNVGHSDSRNLALQLSRCRGLIMKTKQSTTEFNHNDNSTMSDHGDIPMTSSHTKTFDRKQALLNLYPFCNGLAIPLTVDGAGDDSKPKSLNEDKSTGSRFPVLGCALVGHGGQIAATTSSKAQGGSSQPIFVSVGHKISLQEAVRVSASLSVARIPEPVRKADLYGRELMRQREAAGTAVRGTVSSS